MGGRSPATGRPARSGGHNPNVTTHTLETHIYRLRQKVEGDPREPQLLVAENGGYRLHATRGGGPPGHLGGLANAKTSGD